jgi:hypothetical protein
MRCTCDPRMQRKVTALFTLNSAGRFMEYYGAVVAPPFIRALILRLSEQSQVMTGTSIQAESVGRAMWTVCCAAPIDRRASAG